MDSKEVTGLFFDGHDSSFKVASLRLYGGHFELTRDGLEPLRFTQSSVNIRERVGDAPRVIEFPGMMHFETPQNDFVDEHFVSNRWSVYLLEKRWSGAVLAALFLVTFTALVYFFVLPGLELRVAWMVPQKQLTTLSQTVLKYFSLEEVQRPSKKLAESMARVDEAGAKLKSLFPNEHIEILKREGGARFKANAFALPDGTMVVTNELAEILDEPNEILAVLLHEMGHVMFRHGVQQIIHATAVSGFIFTLTGGGDLSSIAGMLITQSNSRDFERQADAFAAKNLRKLGLKAELLSQALRKLEKSAKDKEHVPQFLSTHPLTSEREESLKVYDRP